MIHAIYSRILICTLALSLGFPLSAQEMNPEKKHKKSAHTIILEATQASKKKISHAADKFNITKRDLLQGTAIGSALLGASFLTKDPKLQFTLRILSIAPMIIGLLMPKKVLSKVSDVDIEDGILCSNHACKGICPQCRITKAYLAALPIGFLYYGLSWLFTKQPSASIPNTPDESSDENNQSSDTENNNSSESTPPHNQQPDEQVHSEQDQNASDATEEEDSEESTAADSDPIIEEMPEPVDPHVQSEAAANESLQDINELIGSNDEDEAAHTRAVEPAANNENGQGEEVRNENPVPLNKENQHNANTQDSAHESAKTNWGDTLAGLIGLSNNPEITPAEQDALDYQKQIEEAYGVQQDSSTDNSEIESQKKQTSERNSVDEDEATTESPADEQQSGWGSWLGIW